MPQAAKNQVPGVLPPAAASLSPVETARYTGELLESLRKIAARQGQEMLAHLLELARYEAQSLANPPSRPGGSRPLKPTTPDCPGAGHSVPPVPVPAES